MSHDPGFLPTEARIGQLTELATSVLDSWGGAADPPELFLEGENAVFRANLTEHGLCAVRVDRADYHSEAHLHSQVAWCRALTGDDVVRTATIVDNVDGNSFVLESHPDVPEPRFVSVLTWQSGTSLKEVDLPAAVPSRRLERCSPRSISTDGPGPGDIDSWDCDGTPRASSAALRYSDLSGTRHC